jgi:hypothetical protein
MIVVTSFYRYRLKNKSNVFSGWPLEFLISEEDGISKYK